MNFYTKLDILSFKKCAFAHNFSISDYHYDTSNTSNELDVPKNAGVLEIGFVEENPIILEALDGESHIIEENGIFIITPESRFIVKTASKGLHRHTTAEFLIEYKKSAVEHFCPSKENQVTLPLSIPNSSGSGDAISLIRSIVKSKNSLQYKNFFKECSDFMLLIHKLSQLAENCYEENSIPSNKRYCEKAKAFIEENLSRRLSVYEIAKSIGVSKNYLTNIFSISEGVSLIEYINRKKLSYMIVLMKRYGYPLWKAGEFVGFTDANYISRIFKKYYGITFSEFKEHNLNKQ